MRFLYLRLLTAVFANAATASLTDNGQVPRNVDSAGQMRYEPDSENPYYEPDDTQPGGSGFQTSGNLEPAEVSGTASGFTNPLVLGTEEWNIAEEEINAAQSVLVLIANAQQRTTESVTKTVSFAMATSPSTASAAAFGDSNGTSPIVNGTYFAVGDLRFPSLDIAKALAAEGRLEYWNDFFQENEYDMYKNDPLCFYANQESIYSWGSASYTSLYTVTQQFESAATTTSTFVGSFSSSYSSSLSELYLTALPDNLWSVHFATPSASGKVTATAVSYTTCSANFGGGLGPSLSYRVLKVSEPSSSTAAPLSSVSASTSTTSDAASLTSRYLKLLYRLLLCALIIVV